MSDSQTTEERVLEEDGITVRKSFSTDEFPVPAVTFRLESDRSEPVRIRLTDTIPESFSMDRIGFHPEFESEHWTAYSDHRVEFEQLLEPESAIQTVFGIRGDDIDPEPFLTVPSVDHVPAGETMEDVLGTDGTDPVREVLSGDRESLPGMDSMSESASSDEDEVDGDSDGETEGDDETTVEADPDVDASGPAPHSMDPGTTPAVTDASEASSAVDHSVRSRSEPRAEDDLEAESGEVEPAGSVAAALASEIRAGEVDDSDLEVLRSELDIDTQERGVPRSVDVRIGRLQSQIGDLAAYTDALEAFIDEQGTASGVLEEAQSAIEDVSDRIGVVEERMDDADEEQSVLADGLEDVETELDSLAGDLSEATDRLTDAEDRLAELDGITETVEEVEETVGSLDTKLDDVRDDIADLDSRVLGVEDAVHDDVADLETEIDRIDEELADLEAFRERLNDAFGT